MKNFPSQALEAQLLMHRLYKPFHAGPIPKSPDHLAELTPGPETLGHLGDHVMK